MMPENSHLLTGIISAITETDEKISSILRKCLVLSYLLKNNDLKSWVTKELNGYDASDPDIPQYRRTYAPAKGFFIGGFGQAINDQPIPSAALDEKHRHYAESINLRQPIIAYEDVKASDERIVPWPANMVVLYQNKFFDGDLVLNRAWQSIPGSVLAGIVDTVRTKLLTFVLELQAQLGDGKTSIEDVPSSAVQTLFQFIVVGGNNVFGNVESFTTQTVQTGDVASLRGVLTALGVSNNELEDLENDIHDDHEEAKTSKRLGRKTMEWIKRNAKSAGQGALGIGKEVATSVMTEAIKRYIGL
ncbi:MAG TPA: hypothetical protein GXX48_23150 [Ochrobactrum intermedium]|uniref:AbiTii domain-containing protein n=1 Tax=Brucella intermedia TaxID=94625 RepID=A0A7V6PGE2_9HYPH|nr:hypothetical protein [Brucella intermedia]HHV70497.1 hypothetical protein [Brucella intermedia]